MCLLLTDPSCSTFLIIISNWTRWSNVLWFFLFQCHSSPPPPPPLNPYSKAQCSPPPPPPHLSLSLFCAIWVLHHNNVHYITPITHHCHANMFQALVRKTAQLNPKQTSFFTVLDRLTVAQVLFCSFTKGITLKNCWFCLVLINGVLLKCLCVWIEFDASLQNHTRIPEL